MDAHITTCVAAPVQVESSRLREELQQLGQVAEGKLQQLHEMHASLAEHALAQIYGKPR